MSVRVTVEGVALGQQWYPQAPRFHLVPGTVKETSPGKASLQAGEAGVQLNYESLGLMESLAFIRPQNTQIVSGFI